MTWTPIRYRGFYDFPRVFLTEHDGTVYLFDCPFDPEMDDYAPVYSVFRLEGQFEQLAASSDWGTLMLPERRLGEVPTGQVRFDDTKRATIDIAILASL